MPAGQFYFLPNSLEPHPEIMDGIAKNRMGARMAVEWQLID